MSGFADLIETLLIDFFGDSSFFQILDSGVVGGEHGVEQTLCVAAWLADGERALALHVVASNLRAKTEDERVAFLELIFAGDRVRKGRALTKGDKAAERRLDADSNDVVEFF